jgi:hypothetical protein
VTTADSALAAKDDLDFRTRKLLVLIGLGKLVASSGLIFDESKLDWIVWLEAAARALTRAPEYDQGGSMVMRRRRGFCPWHVWSQRVDRCGRGRVEESYHRFVIYAASVRHPQHLQGTTLGPVRRC